MESAISGTHSDDSTRLKTHIGHYVAPKPLYLLPFMTAVIDKLIWA
jgi:hypothetical protein